MAKGKLNITLDDDHIEYIKIFAKSNRTSVSEIINQFILNLKRKENNDPTRIIISNPELQDALMETIVNLRNNKVEWLDYDEVFE